MLCCCDSNTAVLQTFADASYTFTVKNKDAPRRLISKSAA